MLAIVDDYSRECLALEVDTSLPGARVVAVLERLADLPEPLNLADLESDHVKVFACKTTFERALKNEQSTWR